MDLSEPWLVVGDFNDIIGANKKKRGAPIFATKCQDFVDQINICGLIDLGWQGSRFT